jgi:murein DD-endopeptidase MepM/ murein hydrolase activator NlpD
MGHEVTTMRDFWHPRDMRPGRWLLASLTLTLTTACERIPAGGSDAGATAASANTPAAVAPPTNPALTPPVVDAAAPADTALAADAGRPDAAAPIDAGMADASPLGDGGALPKADPSKLELIGTAIQGGLVRAKLNGKLKKMSFPGHRAVLSKEGEFLVAFARDARPQEKLTITLDDGTVIEHVFEVTQRTYETEKIDGLPKEEVDLDPNTRKDLAKTEAELDKVRKGFIEKPCYKDGFIWPANGKISSHYGVKRVLNGKESGIHWGVDIAAALGSPVRAPACGKVVFAKTNQPLSGNVVLVDHGHGLTSAFLHLNTITVKEGDEVKQGQGLGTVGATGRATGAHLDWRMNLFEVRVDPELLVPQR